MDDVCYFDGVRYKFSGSYFQRGSKKCGERFLHRAVWIKSNGAIPDGHVIHHVDENTRNNDISNLQCMRASEHHTHHFKEMWADRLVDVVGFDEAVRKASAWTRTPEGRKFLSELNAKNRAEGKYDGHDKSAFYAARDAWVKSPECAAFNRDHMMSLRAAGVVGDPSDECRAKAAEWHKSDEGKQWHSDASKAAWAKREAVGASCTVCSSQYQTYTPTRSKFCSGRCKAAALRERRKQNP